MFKAATKLFFLLFAITVLVPAQAIFNTGQIGVTLSDYGRVRIGAPTDANRQIDRSSFVCIKNRLQVFDYKNDGESEIAAALVTPATWGDHQASVRINNTYSNLPPDFDQVIDVFGWANKSFVITRATTINNEAAAVPNAIVGMDVVPQLNGAYGLENLKYDNVTKTLYVYPIDTSSHHYVGYKLLGAEYNSVVLIDWFDLYWVDSLYYDWMALGRMDSSWQSGGDGGVLMLSQQGKNLPAGGSIDMFVAIAYGTSKAGMDAAMAEAVQKYNQQYPSDVKDFVSNPSAYELLQNYPNPFNPSTVISYNQPKEGFAEIKVYDILGNEVAQLFKGINTAGVHSCNFDASGLSNGTYFYTLRAEGIAITKKMTVLK